jgi:hypothetical protein
MEKKKKLVCAKVVLRDEFVIFQQTPVEVWSRVYGEMNGE